MTDCLVTKNLSKSYGDNKALDDVFLKVKTGTIFGFLGPNGAGKSTIIKMLTTLIPPTAGSLNIFGIDAVKFPLRIRKRIGVVLQQPSYEPTLTVEKALDKYGMIWGIPKKERKKRLEELLVEFDLTEFRKIRNVDLSIGQRRRVQVAREFMHDLDLLFLDEATVGLDVSARRGLLDNLKKRAKTGLTIFYTTHILSEVEYICDEVAIINHGKILTVDTPWHIKSKFGAFKTIKIQIQPGDFDVRKILSEIHDCKVQTNSTTEIVIHSEKSDVLLQQVLKILNQNNITIEDLDVLPTSLEDIFLKIIGDSNEVNN